MCPTALAQQIPYFERINPEGICIATYMNASTNLGVISAALYFLYIRFIGPIPHIVAVPIILASSAIAAYLVSAVHATTLHGTSVSLFMCCAIGGSAGALASVVMNPFLTKYKDDFITASRSGGSMCIVLTAVLAAIQSPGSSTPRFSPTYYLLIVAIILSFPIFAFVHIIRNKIGLRSEDVAGLSGRDPSIVEDDSTLLIAHSRSDRGLSRRLLSDSSNEEGEGEGRSQSKGGSNSIDNNNRENGYDRISGTAMHDICSGDELRFQINSPLHTNEQNIIIGPVSTDDVCEANKIIGVMDVCPEIESVDFDNRDRMKNRYENGYDDDDRNRNRDKNVHVHVHGHGSGSGTTTAQRHNASSSFEQFLSQLVLLFVSNPSPWMHQVAPLCAVIGFVNMNTWGILTAVAPFAFKNVGSSSGSGSGSNDGAMLLGYAYEFAAICLMFGDLSTAVLHLPTRWAILFFTVLTSAVYVAALPSSASAFSDSSSTLSIIGPYFLILSYSLGRFFEAHIVTSTYRKIASEFHPSHRESAARVVGAMDMISTTMGSITSSILIATYASCK